MNQSSESNIDRLRKHLNSQKRSSGGEHKESRLSSADTSGIRKRWEHDNPTPGDTNPEPESDNSGGISFLNKLLISSVVFFVLAFAFAAFSITSDGGISPDKVNIEISGPNAVSAGEAVDFDISITNENQVSLHSAELVVTYPEGTRDPANTGEELRRDRQNIGTIPAGEEIKENISASLFGEQGDVRTLSVQLEYRVADSNAIFSADSSYDIEITEAPISLDLDMPSEVTVNESFTTQATVSSNASQILNDVLLVANYPFAFSVQDVEPEASYRQYVWQLGDISPGSERTIEITGVFNDSSAAAQQSFSFDVGTARIGDATEIGTFFASQNQTVELEEPFLDLSLNMDVRQSNSNDGLDIRADINWRSNLNSIVRGGEVTAQLSGEGIDYDSVDSQEGLFRSSSQSVVWNPRTTASFTTISPGDSGELQFQFSTKDSQDLADTTENPTVDIDLQMQAEAPDSSSLPDPVTATREHTLRLPSVIQLTADTLYEDGPFSNSGPIPPEVDEATTYTLHLSITNTTNDITDTRVSAALPAYVEIADTPEPDSNFSYNDVSGRIQWDIGTLEAGAGYSKAPKEIFIPVEVVPSQNQVNQVLPLLEDISITGTDTFREEEVQINNTPTPTTVLDDLRSGRRETGQVQR